MKDVLLGCFKIEQEGHQEGEVGDVIAYPLHLGNEYVKLGILSICDEKGTGILPEQQLDLSFTGDWFHPSDPKAVIE